MNVCLALSILLADQNTRPDERTINQTAGMIEKTLAEFGIVATVIGFRVGPTVTQFAVQPGFMKRAGTTEEEAQQIKVRVAQIASLQKDLALALSAERLRIEAPVPGKPYVGIEVPNSHTSVVRMRSILETEAFHKIGTPLAMALGRDVSGQPVVADLARMPHLLIAGATGSGKSVCITAIGGLSGDEQSAGRSAHGDDRFKDGGVVAFQRLAASVRKGGNEYRAHPGCAALGGGGDGTSLPPA